MINTMINPLIGRRIGEHRRHRGMDVATLAAALPDTSSADLEAIEAGETRASVAQFMAAIDALGVTREDLTDPFRFAPGEGRWHFRTTADRLQDAGYRWGTSNCEPLRMRRAFGERFAAMDGRELAKAKRMISHRRV